MHGPNIYKWNKIQYHAFFPTYDRKLLIKKSASCEKYIFSKGKKRIRKRGMWKKLLKQTKLPRKQAIKQKTEGGKEINSIKLTFK